YDEMIYRDELMKALHYIHTIVSDSTIPKDNNPTLSVTSDHRRHLNIGIFGNRGSGKTSFLLTLLRILDGRDTNTGDIGKYDLVNNFIGKTGSKKLIIEKLHKDIIVGGLLEPSRMESDSRIVTEIFTQMIELLKTQVNESRFCKKRWEENEKELRNSISAVNKNLPTILNVDRLKHAYSERGVQGVQDEIMENRSGERLEKSLWYFTKICLTILDKKYIVFGLDDVDMSCERAFEVMESLRLYLTHNNMLVLLTGDENLFNIILFEEFRKKLWAKQDETGKEFVVNIVSQYLQKILPPGLKINLKQLSTSEFRNIYIFTKESKTEKPEYSNFPEMYQKFINTCLSTDLNQIDALEDYFYLIPEDIRRLTILNKLMLDNSNGNKNGSKGVKRSYIVKSAH
ncbi:hypothetical protein K8T06_01350, partial [bacterium]|nr:hypothetical protein [bacterium]